MQCRALGTAQCSVLARCNSLSAGLSTYFISQVINVAGPFTKVTSAWRHPRMPFYRGLFIVGIVFKKSSYSQGISPTQSCLPWAFRGKRQAWAFSHFPLLSWGIMVLTPHRPISFRVTVYYVKWNPLFPQRRCTTIIRYLYWILSCKGNIILRNLNIKSTIMLKQEVELQKLVCSCIRPAQYHHQWLTKWE